MSDNNSEYYDDNEQSFIYERLHTAPGIKLEIVAGGAPYSPKVRLMLARQVWSENARDGYRAIEHTEAGAPLLIADTPESLRQRISVSHTSGLLAVATLPPADNSDISTFSPHTALGIDVERIDRSQVLGVRTRFLNDVELKLIPADDICANILAWTCKEAMMKMTFNTAADIRSDLVITLLPCLDGTPGRGIATLPDGAKIDTILHTIPVAGGKIAATLAFTDSTLRFGTRQLRFS